MSCASSRSPSSRAPRLSTAPSPLATSARASACASVIRLEGCLAVADELCGTYENGATVLEPDDQIAAGHVNRDRTLAPSAGDGRGGDRDCGRAGGGGLPRPPLPHQRPDVVVAVGMRELHVRPARETSMRLD